MDYSVVTDTQDYTKRCKCGELAIKEITKREMPFGIQTHYYCLDCFNQWKKDQELNEDDMKALKDKLIKGGMSEEDVNEALKEIYKK